MQFVQQNGEAWSGLGRTKYVQFSRCLNVSSHCHGDGDKVTSEDKPFEMHAPAREKARRLTVESLTAGTNIIIRSLREDRSFVEM